jgi:hypothetical protein
MSLEIEKRFKTFDYNKIKKILKDNDIKKVGGFLIMLKKFYQNQLHKIKKYLIIY